MTTATVFARTCRAEWSRLWTVKATWWFLAAAAVIMVGLGTIAGFEAGSEEISADSDPAWKAAQFGAMPAQFAILAVALMAVTAEYATGGIVPTLQWTPKRSLLFLARATVAVATATAAGVIIGIVASVAAYTAARPALQLPLNEGFETLSTVAMVFSAGAALAVGLGFLLRNTAGGLVAVFLLLFLLPILLPQFGHQVLTDIADLLPGTNALFLLFEEPTERGFTYMGSMLTMWAWAVGALFFGWLRLVRDDANR